MSTNQLFFRDKQEKPFESSNDYRREVITITGDSLKFKEIYSLLISQ